MPELTIEWRSVAKELPPEKEPVLVWYQGRPAVGLWTPQRNSAGFHVVGFHDWLVYPSGACPVAPYPQYHPKWWTAIAAPSDEPASWGVPSDFGEIHVVWRGSVTDLYTDLFPLLTPSQLAELGRKLIGQPGGHVARMAGIASSQQQASSECGVGSSCPFRASTVLSQLVDGRSSIVELAHALKGLLGGENHDMWKAFLHVMTKEQQPPVPMLLRCPSCNERHIDEGEFGTKPHHTHACQICGEVWRPAIVNTVGVHFLPGFRNQQTADSRQQTASEEPEADQRAMLDRVRDVIDRVMENDHALRGELMIVEELDGFVPARKS